MGVKKEPPTLDYETPTRETEAAKSGLIFYSLTGCLLAWGVILGFPLINIQLEINYFAVQDYLIAARLIFSGAGLIFGLAALMQGSRRTAAVVCITMSLFMFCGGPWHMYRM